MGLKKSTTFHLIIRFVRTEAPNFRIHAFAHFAHNCEDWPRGLRDSNLLWSANSFSRETWFGATLPSRAGSILFLRLYCYPAISYSFFSFFFSLFYYKKYGRFLVFILLYHFVEFTCGYIMGKLWRKGRQGEILTASLYTFSVFFRFSVDALLSR